MLWGLYGFAAYIKGLNGRAVYVQGLFGCEVNARESLWV
jgi:hypothetical protein